MKIDFDVKYDATKIQYSSLRKLVLIGSYLNEESIEKLSFTTRIKNKRMEKKLYLCTRKMEDSFN